VLSRPRIIGEIYEADRQPIQPQIHAKTYDYNRQEGVVTQVVIQPRNRLVTHAVVSSSDFHDGKSACHEYLLPVEAMDVVNKESVLLKRNGPPLNTFPTFKLSDYSLAPFDWRPPYPYSEEMVHWPHEQCERAKSELDSD
jgi:hypothetical protein